MVADGARISVKPAEGKNVFVESIDVEFESDIKIKRIEVLVQ